MGVEADTAFSAASAGYAIVHHVDTGGGILLYGIGVDIHLDLNGAVARAWAACG